MKNLTRYTREKTSFLGWRVCISRKGLMFTKYFADAMYDGEQGSFEAARALRDEILTRIKADPTNTKQIMLEYQEKFAKKPQPEK
ncbi:MAG: hypothetical protein IJA63_10525 [Akkermansia sp.]|nr:hypothetical protein [Akkermansia sp.]